LTSGASDLHRFDAANESTLGRDEALLLTVDALAMAVLLGCAHERVVARGWHHRHGEIADLERCCCDAFGHAARPFFAASARRAARTSEIVQFAE
jgi:hypothetical protein